MFIMDCKNVTFHIKFNFCMFLDKGMLTFSFIKTCTSWSLYKKHKTVLVHGSDTIKHVGRDNHHTYSWSYYLLLLNYRRYASKILVNVGTYYQFHETKSHIYVV